MAGFLFVVCIPREHYEKCLSNFRQSSEDELETAREELNRANSYDSNKRDIVPIADEPQPSTSKAADERDYLEEISEFRGSMDSDLYIRNLEREKRAKENEEAVEKFFKPEIVDNPSKFKSMESVMRDIVDKMLIRNVSWQKVNNKNSYKIIFSLEKGGRCDETIHLLSEFGIGQKKGSSCVIIPCSVYKDKSHLRKPDADTSDIIKETSWNKHIGKIRARLNVEKLVHAVKSDAALSFDFVILLVTASMVASFGLVDNNILILTASMLISPLMGPILAATLGFIIKDHKLQWWAIGNEVIGIYLCIVVGYLFGIVVCILDYLCGFAIISLTPEMLSRCSWQSVIVGIFIALLSGAAQSIALLRENFGSLVGVAISASLLPPAVNTGLMWSYSSANVAFQFFGIQPSEKLLIEHPTYHNNPAIEFVILGSLSLFLTILNVICVYFMGYIFLRIKIEVAPVSTEEERQFWKHDIPITRDYNKTLHTEDGRRLRDELDNYVESDTEDFKGVAAELLKQEFYPYTHTWSPLMHKISRKDQKRTSVMDFYKSMTNKVAAEEENTNQHSNNRSFFLRHSDPIKSPKPRIATEETFARDIGSNSVYINVDGESSNEEEKKSRRKFLVTPAKDE